jgi:ATP-dependent Clp endopeptidase proteolytic subunit ClpP
MKPQAKVLDDGTVMLFGVIGDEWDGLTAKAVVEQIKGLGSVEEIKVLINSPGGSVFDGLAIYHELKTNPANVVIEIAGVAASMASAIAMAGDVVRIAKNAHVMIHDPWNVAVGDAEDLRKAAEVLEQFGESLVSIYAEKTGLGEDEIRQMMQAETWLTAEEALEKGFVDEIIQPVEASAFADLDVSTLAGVPAALTRAIREGRQMTIQKKTPEEEAAALPGLAAQEPKVPDVATAVNAALDARAQADRERCKGIRALATKVGLGEAWADACIRDGSTLAEANGKALDALATRQQGQDGPGFIPSGVTVTADARDKWLEGMAQWLFVKSGQAGMIAKHTGTKPEPGNFRGMSLVDIARDALEMQGVRTRGMTPLQVAKAATAPRAEAGLGTRSDFPVLLENVLYKMLKAAYDTAPDKWRQIAAVGSVQDFRAHPRLRLGSLPRLDTLLESGEFRSMHFPDAEKATIQAGTFGNVIGLTRQAIVNDDVDGFSRLVTMLGRAAARSIEIDVFALLASNAGTGPSIGPFKGESVAQVMFHSSRANIDSTSAVPSQAALERCRVLMASQLDPDANDYLDLRPAVWVGPIGLGATVRASVASEFDFDAETTATTGKFMKPNVVRDLVSVIVDTPRLSGTRWYLLADPAIAPVLEVAFLQGQESPVIETEEGFDYDGIRWRVRHDYGVAGTDFRGGVTNAGA